MEIYVHRSCMRIGITDMVSAVICGHLHHFDSMRSLRLTFFGHSKYERLELIILEHLFISNGICRTQSYAKDRLMIWKQICILWIFQSRERFPIHVYITTYNISIRSLASKSCTVIAASFHQGQWALSRLSAWFRMVCKHLSFYNKIY